MANEFTATIATAGDRPREVLRERRQEFARIFSAAAIEDMFQTFRQVMAQLHGCVRGAFTDQGMSMGQMVLLRVLIHRGSATPKELADTLSVTTGNITGLVDKLEKAGLVTRTRSTEDRRVVHVELTAKARARFKQVHRASVDMLSEAFDGWTLREIQDLQRLLVKLASRRPREIRVARAPRPPPPMRHVRAR